MPTMILRWALLLGLAMSPGVTSAEGLFCVMDFAGKRCWYSDIVSCQQAAGDTGTCSINEGAMIPPSGGSPFCIVESWKTSCIYQDQTDCQKQASARRAVCIANPNTTR